MAVENNAEKHLNVTVDIWLVHHSLVLISYAVVAIYCLTVSDIFILQNTVIKIFLL